MGITVQVKGKYKNEDVQAWNTTSRNNNQSSPWAIWHLYLRASKLYASTYYCLFPIRQEYPSLDPTLIAHVRWKHTQGKVNNWYDKKMQIMQENTNNGDETWRKYETKYIPAARYMYVMGKSGFLC